MRIGVSLLLFRIPDRQREAKRHTAFRIPSRPQPAPIGFDYGSADGKPHSHALGLRRDKPLEDAAHNFFIHSGTGIAYIYRDDPGRISC